MTTREIQPGDAPAALRRFRTEPGARFTYCEDSGLYHVRAFLPDGDRYRYDSALCVTGWSQVDTREDAWYYGQWADASALAFACYAEGDLTATAYPDGASFAAALIRAAISRPDLSIDPGIGDAGAARAAAFRDLGLGFLMGDDAISPPGMPESLRNFDVAARVFSGWIQVETRDPGDVEPGAGLIEIVEPPVTLSLILDKAPEALAEWLDSGGDPGDAHDVQEMLYDWRTERGGDEWADSFWPEMAVAWPVELPGEGGPDESTVAARLTVEAPNVSLVRLYDRDGAPDGLAFVLTGGGMDFSDELARAYLSAETVPPFALLQRREVEEGLERSDRGAAAYVHAAKYLERRARDLNSVAINSPAVRTRYRSARLDSFLEHHAPELCGADREAI